MICKIDDKKTFAEEQDYTVKCEACNLWCKVDRYRSCEERHAWNKEQGVDVFRSLSAIDRLAQVQQGVSDSATLPGQSNRPVDRRPIPQRSRHRGR